MELSNVPLSTEQGGFRKNRSTIDQVGNLHNVIKLAQHDNGKLPIVAYMDIKAAYDLFHANCFMKNV